MRAASLPFFRFLPWCRRRIRTRRLAILTMVGFQELSPEPYVPVSRYTALHQFIQSNLPACILSWHFEHTAKVFLLLALIRFSQSCLPFRSFNLRIWCISNFSLAPHNSHFWFCNLVIRLFLPPVMVTVTGNLST